MPNTLPSRFSDSQLIKIIDEATIYMCACPAQVAREITRLREVYVYQRNCLQDGSLMAQVHERIADSTRIAHAEMEQCLDDVLRMEGWDRDSLTMPAGLRKLRDQAVE